MPVSEAVVPSQVPVHGPNTFISDFAYIRAIIRADHHGEPHWLAMVLNKLGCQARVVSTGYTHSGSVTGIMIDRGQRVASRRAGAYLMTAEVNAG
jgi:uncharacterized protein involved in propanediol utilization